MCEIEGECVKVWKCENFKVLSSASSKVLNLFSPQKFLNQRVLCSRSCNAKIIEKIILPMAISILISQNQSASSPSHVHHMSDMTKTIFIGSIIVTDYYSGPFFTCPSYDIPCTLFIVQVTSVCGEGGERTLHSASHSSCRYFTQQKSFLNENQSTLDSNNNIPPMKFLKRI